MVEDFITKIEGHGRLKVDWKKNKVVLEVHEGERLFEGILVGRPAAEAAWITARICGVCPTAHNLCALKAVEDALGIAPDSTTILLRRLHLAGQMIQSHALHLYFLAFPDYLGIDSGLELKIKHPKYFQAALTLKEVSDEIAKVIGGRATHPTTTTVGGFHKTPTTAQLKQLKKRLKEALPAAESTFHLAVGLEYPDLKTDLLFLSQVNKKDHFNVYESPLTQGGDGTSWPASDYKKKITEEIRRFSTAKFGFYQKKPVMVGSLARLAIQGKKLKGKTKRFFTQAKLDLQNPFQNNLAQAIEIVHFTEESLELIDTILGAPSAKIKKPKSKGAKTGIRTSRSAREPCSSLSLGIGALEAPRGGLYHEYMIDRRGLISKANVITPTVQNLGSLEVTTQNLIDQTKDLKRERRKKLLEMLVRAYDPCITCSVH